jgi:hypothetical protein
MENTSGFYKLEDSQLLYGPNGVMGPTYDLERSSKDAHTYPVEGWYWFDSEADAREFFELTEGNDEP